VELENSVGGCSCSNEKKSEKEAVSLLHYSIVVRQKVNFTADCKPYDIYPAQSATVTQNTG